ncbi:TIGR01459 family HAD-type hydrolase [Paracoccus pacificus]|uniref:TIGR01459 family HAD-type hydrolase n=1 Tax=Paracoccus pacificus TaxID=1463598 RepID=A0ABW4R9F7_9RHOB
MTRVIARLADISSDYDTLFCDLWGCLHNGREPYPAAVAALQGFRKDGKRVVLMTNAPRPSQSVIAQLDRMGVPRDAWDIVVSSGDAAQVAMLDGWAGHNVWHLGTGKDDGFFNDLPEDRRDAAIVRVPFEVAEGIVNTGPFNETTETPEDYRKTFQKAIARDLPMLCANPDIVVDLGDRRIYCAGALAQLYAEMGGRVALFGKPHAPIYDLARKRLGVDNSNRTLAIGDGIATDVLGAAEQGIDALFVTGGLAFDAFGDDVENPDHGMLTGWLDPHKLSPEFAIGRLR